MQRIALICCQNEKFHMQVRFYLLVGALVLLLSSCRKTSDFTDGYIIEKHCEERIVNGSKVSICFNKMLEDSRCPLRAMCVWQGVAKGNFSFRAGNQQTELDLSTVNFKPGYTRDTVLFGYKIHLVDFKPYPGEGSFVPRAKVDISKE
jgi:hypothetical protein